MRNKKQLMLKSLAMSRNEANSQFLDCTDKSERDQNEFKQFLQYRRVGSVINSVMVFSLLLVFIFVCPVWAKTYYVKNGGNDSLTGTSDATAWATIAKVQATVKSGDTVYFRSQDTWQGAAPILNATEGVTYDGSSYGSGIRAKFEITKGYASGGYPSIYIKYSNVTLRGIELDAQNLNAAGIYVGFSSVDVDNTTIDNCVVHGTGTVSGTFYWMYAIGIIPINTHTVRNTVITNCEVYNSPRHEGIAIYAAWGTYHNINDTVLVKGCYLHDNGTTGLAINNDARNVTAEYNTIINNGSNGISIRVSPEAPANTPAAPTNMKIRYNIIGSNDMYGVVISNPGNHVMNGDFYGNLIYENGDVLNTAANGVDFYITTSPEYVYTGSSFNIYNNTFYSVSNPNTNQRAVVAFGYTTGSLSGLTVNFKNNIVYSGNYWAVVDNKGATVNHSNNLVFRSSGASEAHVLSKGINYNRTGVKTWEQSAQNTDPNFNGGTLPTGFIGTYGKDLMPNTNYFAIQSGNVINKGATLGSPYNGSINGSGLAIPIVRPQGTGFDIGAYEWWWAWQNIFDQTVAGSLSESSM